jgi:hypothetical protein
MGDLHIVVVPLHYSPYVGLGIPKVSWSVSVHSALTAQGFAQS